ncbi:unnamed protein product [Meganyctiphanes norvegica]|uniref:Uncharacterized protein n=1 Tax=Meganyctiphanes norvegica TaxID=48144 RepID=A0AAV2QMR3_MEGNR
MVTGCTPYSTRSFSVAEPNLQQFCNNAEDEFICADCKTLVICIDGKPYTEPCEYGSVCSMKRSFKGGVCYPGEPAECTCNKADIFRRDYYNPSKFLTCGIEGSEPIIHTCPEGLVFNEQKRACGTEIESSCTASGTFAVEDDCSRYYSCIFTTGGWVQKEFTCRNNTMFNEETGICEDPCDWYSGHFSCEAEGRYANPSDCTKYYECFAERHNPDIFIWVEHECPEGYEWNQMVKSGVGHCVASGTAKDKCVPQKPNQCKIPDEWCKAESISCNSQISNDRSYFISPNFPESHTSPNPCVVKVIPPENAVQVKLEFESMILNDPLEGDCGNDSFIVIGGNPGSNLPILCGDNSGQHMYIDIDNSADSLLLQVQASDYNHFDLTSERKWKIKVSFLDDESAVPQRCLQYFSKTQGIIKSFNYAEDYDYAMALNNLDYSVCFSYVNGYCNINFNFNGTLGETTWDDGIAYSARSMKGLKNKERKARCYGYGRDCWDDYIQIGPQKICGDLDDLVITGNSTGPMHLAIKTDDSNESADAGFYVSYTMMPCTY